METVALFASLLSIVLAIVAIYYAFKFSKEGQKSLEQARELLSAVGKSVRYIERMTESFLRDKVGIVYSKEPYRPSKTKKKPAQGK